ncbi:MAG TPA: hypothetical protein ENL08_00405 [Bacteroidetes bacterium]|nr:hypothetical protein [Bacteroidota bacterium]
MALIVIRRIVGSLIMTAGILKLCAEIGWGGTIGVLLVLTGFAIVAGSKEFFWSVAKEHRLMREKKAVASD